MKARAILFTLILASFVSIDHAQITPTIEWQRNLGGSDDDVANAVKSTADGGFIVAGVTQSNDIDVTSSHGKNDMWVIKLSSSGVVEWQKCYGGTDHDDAHDIEETSDHGFIIAGTSKSSDGDATNNYGGDDAWLIKTDSLGNMMWQKNYGGSLSDVANDIDITDDHGYLMAGYSKSHDHDLTSNKGGNDYWIEKLDSDGQIIWQTSLGGSGDEYATVAAFDHNGNIIVNGYSDSMDGDVIGNHSNKNDYWVVKLDTGGEVIWKKCFGGSRIENGRGVVITDDNGMLISGNVQSNDGDVSGIHDSIADYWFVRLDQDGNLLWQKCDGGTLDDCCLALAATSDNGFIATGHTFSHDDGDVTGHDGAADFWQVKLDSLGNIQWELCIGGIHGTYGDYPFDVAEAKQGGYVVVGRSDSYDNDLTSNNGKFDFWVVKLTCDQPSTFYSDADSDGYGSSSSDSVVACSAPLGYVSNSDDCDDSNGAINPAAADVCNGIDDNCNGVMDENGFSAIITQTGSVIICLGSSTILTANNEPGIAYQWLKNGVNISGATNSNYATGNAASYQVSEKNRFNCTSTSVATTIILASKPAATITPVGNLDICVTRSVDLKANGGTGLSYQWKKSSGNISGATNKIYTATEIGKYKVVVTNRTGCNKTSAGVTVTKSCKESSSVTDVSNAEIKLYPNPTAGTFTLNLKLSSDENSEAVIQVLNIIGQAVFDETTSVVNGVLQKGIQLGDAAADGMYLVKVIINDQVYTAQINFQK